MFAADLTRAAHERLALVLFLIEICVVTPNTWNSRSADLRSFVEVYVMAVIVLLGLAPPAAPTAGSLAAPRGHAEPATGTGQHHHAAPVLGLTKPGPG